MPALAIPIPLYIVSMTMKAVDDLLWLSGKVSGRCRAGRVSPAQLSGIGRDILAELRSHGRWRMVEVITEEARIHIDFY